MVNASNGIVRRKKENNKKNKANNVNAHNMIFCNFQLVKITFKSLYIAISNGNSQKHRWY